MKLTELHNALQALRSKGVIAYPTESVFGLGCDPDCDIAINKILTLKQRPAHKGLILVAANMEQLTNYADFSLLNETQLANIKKTWPGPYTWIVPAKKSLSELISGNFKSVAVRVSSHPIIQIICTEYGKPIVSTSANLSGEDACTDSTQVATMFANHPLLNHIIDQPVSGLSAPSQIIDAITGQRLR